MDQSWNSIVGSARTFFAQHRAAMIRTSIISLTEVAVAFPNSVEAWAYFKKWTLCRLHDGIAQAAADVDRQMEQRLGANDTWIAGFCLYYRQPIISRDTAFDRVPRRRRLAY